MQFKTFPFATIVQLLVYVGIVLLFYSSFEFAIGPDFISYYAIAEHYTNGDLKAALNSWWSPLFSWLTVPFVKLGVAPLLANKILQAIIGWYCFLICKKIVQFFYDGEMRQLEQLLFVGLIPVISYWVLASDTPDLLVAALLLHFLLLIINLIKDCSLKKASYAGFIGGLAVLAKSYNFYFIVLFSLAILCYYLIIRKDKQAIVLNFGSIALAFFITVGIWVVMLYCKTGKWQLTSRAEHQICAIEVPQKNNTPLQPYDCSGLGLDSNSKYSNWEQPQLYTSSSFADALIKSETILSKLSVNASIFMKNYISVYQFLIVLVLLFFNFKWIKKYLFLILSYVLIYTGGHFVFHLESRFFIMPVLLLAILSIVSIKKYMEFYKLQKYIIVANVFLMVLLIKTPLLQLLEHKKDNLVVTMYNFANKKTGIHKKNIAAEQGLFENALYYCFFTQNKCVGVLNTTGAVESESALNLANADFLLTKNRNNSYALLPLINGKIVNIR